MAGVITFKHIFFNTGLVISEYGFRVYWRCLLSALRRDGRTFLSVVFEG